MKSLFKISLVATFMLFCGWLSQTEFKDMKQDNSIKARQQRQEVIDDNQDGQHDSNCMCGYCEEGYIDSLSLR